MRRTWVTISILTGVSSGTFLLLAILGVSASIPFVLALVALPVANWWVCGLLVGLKGQGKEVAILAHNVQASVLTAVGSTYLAILSASSLFPWHLPKNVALGMLLISLILVSLRQPLFLIEFYADRFR